MKLCGILSYYQESPHWLSTAVAGMGRICDTLIALDGAYALFPGARPRSHPKQAEAILQMAETMDMECLIHRPKEIYWGNEVEKRNMSLKLAGTVLEPGRDWVLVFDADIHMLMCNPDTVRAELAETQHDVATYTALDGIDFLADAKLAEYANGRPVDPEWTVRTKDIYRWDPTLRYGPAHWTVSRMRNGAREWLRGPANQEPDAHDLNRALVVYHRTADRSRVRKRAAETYYKVRQEVGPQSSTQYHPPTH